MIFGGQDFSAPDSVPDDLLDLGAPDQLAIDPRQLGLQGPDLAPQLTMPGQTDDEVAEDVETDLLHLLENGDREMLALVASDRPTASIVSEDIHEFRMSYARAVRVNPALKWYARLARLLPAEKFGVANGSLQIHMPPQMFRKAVAPFLGDFHEGFAGVSPITAAVRSLAAATRQAGVQASRHTIQGGMRSQSNVEASDFNPALADFGAAQVDDAISAPPELDPMPVAPEPMPSVPRLPISLTDLSLKAVADHIADLDGDDNTLMDHLLDAGFAKAKANEILAMARYKRLLNARRQAGYAPIGNRGAGDIEFSFR